MKHLPIPSRNTRPHRGFCLFPGYRWCGPGCSGPGTPVNAVDAACKAHDGCYRRPGMTRRVCDQQFMNRLEPFLRQHTEEGRRARQMYRLMQVKMLF
ncbi:phospholipase [Virgibacillus halophilus]|uniref:Phospholipase n=1 Tax=Tigheibacillus halophilus TaxID=361280 RepID=A0ABU5C3D5_9BACI|nr:phospholipase [Virgibacillus halophilus]